MRSDSIVADHPKAADVPPGQGAPRLASMLSVPGSQLKPRRSAAGQGHQRADARPSRSTDKTDACRPSTPKLGDWRRGSG